MLFMRNIPIEFSKSDILRYLGFRPKKSTSSAAVEALLDQAIEAARLVIEPAVLVKTLNVERIYSQKLFLQAPVFHWLEKILFDLCLHVQKFPLWLQHRIWY